MTQTAGSRNQGSVQSRGFDQGLFRSALGRYASGITIVAGYDAGTFTVNILSREQQAVSSQFARRGTDKSRANTGPCTHRTLPEECQSEVSAGRSQFVPVRM
jgi:flavin reductase (DIM6/NTAB) family NADH-FMN oxidoreductase RutF